MDHGARTFEIAAGNPQGVNRRPEIAQRVPYPFDVRHGGVNPNVEILRRAGQTVRGERVRADDEKAHLMVQQGEQKVDPVVRHSRGITRQGMRERG